MKITTMSYTRVIPRDLFNEANLLKCYGQIYIALETAMAPDAELVDGDTEEGFHITQDENGGLTITNVNLVVRGQVQRLSRPLNSREAFPLYLETDDGDEIEVFSAGGQFTPEMLVFLRGDQEEDSVTEVAESLMDGEI